MKSDDDLELYQKAFDIANKIREESLMLDSPDKYEVGLQIRRSSQSIVDNIIEGSGRRPYKAVFTKFLISVIQHYKKQKSGEIDFCFDKKSCLE